MLLQYLRQHRTGLLAAALCAGIFAVCFALYDLPLGAVLYPALLCLLTGGVLLTVGYLRALRRHRAMLESRKAALLAQLPEPRTVAEADERALVEALREQLLTQQSASDEKLRNMTEYYTAWAHQIKTPIAAMHLTLQNEDTPSARRLSAELFRVEQYVEMVMTYLRLEPGSSDYAVTLTDSNGTFQNDQWSIEGTYPGVEVRQSGNNLKVWATAYGGEADITLKRKLNIATGNALCAFTGEQSCVTGVADDPLFAKLTIKLPSTGNLKIIKTAPDGMNKSNIRFDIYEGYDNLTNGKIFATVYTNADGVTYEYMAEMALRKRDRA